MIALVVIILVLFALVALVGAPIARAARGGYDEEAAERVARRADLEAAKEAKYREIRDLELDHRTGKVGEVDHRRADRQLRAEAVAILRDLDALDAETPPDA